MSIHAPGLANRITQTVLMCKIVLIVYEAAAFAGCFDTSPSHLDEEEDEYRSCRNGNKN